MKKTILTFAAAAALSLLVGCASSDYEKAKGLYDEGKYVEAAAIFTDLGDYEDSSEQLKACRYGEAGDLLKAGDYDAAEAIFTDLGDYENSDEGIRQSQYGKACKLMDDKEYEAAAAAFEALGDYRDSSRRMQEANSAQLHLLYGDVYDALNGAVWYYNGGSNTKLNSISFDDTTATIAQVTFDGNGKHDGGKSTNSYVVDSDNITVTLADGSDLTLAYTLEGKTIKLSEKKVYFTPDQVKDGLQGCWRLRSEYSGYGIEDNIKFEQNTVTYQKASEGRNLEPGEYWFYGPYSGSYTIKFGGIDSTMDHAHEWFFNIIKGRVVPMHYDNVCERVNYMPGQNDYYF